jgi:proline iminopeptidase
MPNFRKKGNKMKKLSLITYLLLIAAITIHAQQINDKRESIHDRIIFIEPKLIREIPKAPRLCDQLPLKKQRINVGDCTLYVEEEGSGTPLVLINGGPGGTHHGFHPWFGRAAKYARVIYYDQRGCGLSDYTPGKDGYSVEQATDDLEAIRKALKIEKWIVLGYSYGGFLAQYYTLRYPASVSGLVLLGASPGLLTSMGASREEQFFSDQERDRIREINKELNELIGADKISREEYMKLLVYNNHLNGDWKRQQYYKPSTEKFAQIALYEWVHDNNFNAIMNQSASKIDLTGAFAANPIPTLILEGKWDLTWSEQKKDMLKANHPRSRMVVFENAAHGIYDEETEKFFSVLRDFVTTLSPVDQNNLEVFRGKIAEWDKMLHSRPDYKIQSVGWGIVSSKKLVEEYRREDLEQLTEPSQYLRMGFAHYDMKQYGEALFIFELFEKKFGSDTAICCMALIWQGHMHDLLGEREEALVRYKIVAALNSKYRVQHGQYNLSYELSPYAKERMETPFKRIENQNVD